MLFRRKSIQCRHLRPAIAEIISSCCSISSMATSEPEIFRHMFSNGGSQQARNLLLAWAESTAYPFPRHVTVFDSCPGRAKFRRSLLALSASLPSSAVRRIPLILIISLMLCLYWLLHAALGIPNPIERVAECLNNPKLANEACRCYIYSDIDPMVDWHAVEDHAQETKIKGFVVRQERFLDSGHCAHAKVGGDVRYWRIIRDLWRAGAAERF